MIRMLKLAHIGGLVVFLGSIPTFTVISALTVDASLENIAFGRGVISTGTQMLTLPGMWMTVITGIWMGRKRYGLKQRFIRLKLLLVSLIVLNAHVLIVPAASMATEIAIRSLTHDRLLPAYTGAYLQESIFGAANVLLAVMAAVIGVWRLGVKPAA